MHVSRLAVAAVILFAVACNRPPETPPAANGGGEDGHEHVAPHGGTLVELGEELAHVELLLDSTTGMLTAYALDGEAEAAVRIPQAAIAISVVTPGATRADVTLSGVSNTLTGETESDTSLFRATVPALKGVTEFEGTIKAVVVRGQQFEDVAFRYPSTEHP